MTINLQHRREPIDQTRAKRKQHPALFYLQKLYDGARIEDFAASLTHFRIQSSMKALKSMLQRPS